MTLVLALLLTTLCGVHAASIPSNSPGVLARKSDNKLENLDKIRRSVLEDMKRLLDSQLAALFESAVTRKAESQRKRLKSKTKPHPTVRTGETTPDVESVFPEDEPEELIKVLTDDSLQDPSDEMLRDAVDQLLKEDEGEKADDIDNSEIYNKENQLNGSNSGNSEEVFGDDAFDDATPPINNTDNDRKKGKSNKKGISHVIIEHMPKSNKNDDDKNIEDILDLDKILKSALKDYSGSLSHEDDNSRDEDNIEGDSGTTNPSLNSSHEKEALFTNSSDTGLRMHDPEDSGLQFDGTNNVDVDGNTIRTENLIKNNQDNDHNGETDTRQNSTNNDDYKTNHHKHNHHHRKKSKGRQQINYNVSNENHTLIWNDTNGARKDYDKDDNETKNFKLGEIEMRKDHEERQHLHRKSKNRYSKNHTNKNHHSKHRSRNHDKHNHNDNETHDHSAKGHHLIVRLISDSDGSNESKMNTMPDTTTHKKMGHSVSSGSREGHQDSKKMYNRDGNNDSSESRKHTINEENASRNDDKDTNNLTEIEDLNSKKEERTVIARDDDTEEDESYSREDELNERPNVTNENSSEVDNEQITREGNSKTGETERGKEEKNTDHENILIEKDRSVADSENDAINSTEKVPSEKNRARKEIIDTEAKIKISDNEEVATEKHKRLKSDETHKCHHEKIGNENDEIHLIHDLLQNKEMKKSYSLSLTLSTN